MSFYKNLSYYCIKDQVFITRPKYVINTVRIREGVDTTFVPRFSLKDTDIFQDFPANTEVKYNPELIKRAIKWGMIIKINYRGEEDDVMEGHERFIYPMVYGRSKANNDVVRGFHLKGLSVSNGGKIEKIWRMFRCDRILSMSFTGAFFRIAPEGYNMDDKGMTKIFARADFTDIRNLQQSLLDKDRIDTEEHTILTKVNNIEAKDLNWELKLFNPWQNNVIPKRDAKTIRVTFAKPVVGDGPHIALVGISVNTNSTFELKVNSKVVGKYKSIKWKMADRIEGELSIDGVDKFKAYLFLRNN